MTQERATAAQRGGILLSTIEALMLGFVAAMHFGFEMNIRGMTFSAPFLYPAAIIEAVLALGLALAIVLPAPSSVRAGRVMAAQMLVVIGLFVGQVAIMYGASLTTMRNQILYGALFVFSLGSIVLLALPLYRRRASRI